MSIYCKSARWVIFLHLSLLLLAAHSFLVGKIPLNSHHTFQLLRFARKSNDDNSAASSSTSIVTGVSVSPTGFWVVVPVTDTTFVPLRISTSDTTGTATSPAALTILQLLASVDMAGAVFPPETLSRILQKEGAETTGNLRFEHVKATKTSQDDSLLEDDAFSFSLHCTALNDKDASVNIPLDETCLPEPLATDGTTTLAFLAIALALRYQIPLQWTKTGDGSPLPAIQEQFPAFQTTQTAVLKPAQASAAQLEQGFEIHTLQAALKLARDKGDDKAAAKIRARIDQWDAQSFAQLPVQPESDTSSMQ